MYRILSEIWVPSLKSLLCSQMPCTPRIYAPASVHGKRCTATQLVAKWYEWIYRQQPWVYMQRRGCTLSSNKNELTHTYMWQCTNSKNAKLTHHQTNYWTQCLMDFLCWPPCQHFENVCQEVCMQACQHSAMTPVLLYAFKALQNPGNMCS